MTAARWCLAMIIALPLLVLTGCKGEEKPPPVPVAMPKLLTPPQPIEETEPHAAGKKVFNANKCVACHTMGGPQAEAPPQFPGKGPDLAKIASKPKRDVEWFVAYVSDAKKVNAESKMPSFESKIQAADMRALAEFLASLK